MNVLKNYINGKFVDSESSRLIEYMNPALDEPLGKVPMSTKEEVNSVVKAAKDAFPDW
ncbi:MAG: aldehyde dehydrogenase family protein, partial [Promethearchaeota archaeon]